MSPQQVLKLSKQLMPMSIAAMAAGAYVGFIDHENWSLLAQVVAHIGIMLGAGVLKLSYVMYLNASMHLGINDYAGREEPAPAQAPLMECCIATGRRCV